MAGIAVRRSETRGGALLRASAAAILAIALGASSAIADGGAGHPWPAEIDPSARMQSGGSAGEWWDWVIELESGHRIFQRFMITNAGPGDHSGVALGVLVFPDGEIVEYHNGRMRSRWEISADRLRLDMGSSHLDLHAPAYRLQINKRQAKIDLQLRPGGQWRIPISTNSPDPEGDLRVDLLALNASIEGTLQIEGESKPLFVSGRACLTHTVAEMGEEKLSARRVELFDLQGDRGLYWIEVLPPKQPEGNSVGWAVVADGVGGTQELYSGALPPAMKKGSVGHTSASRYWLARTMSWGSESEGWSGGVRVGQVIAQHDPLGKLPRPIRMFLSWRTRPHRVWAESSFDVTITPNSGSASLQVQGTAVAAVSFANPVPRQ